MFNEKKKKMREDQTLKVIVKNGKSIECREIIKLKLHFNYNTQLPEKDILRLRLLFSSFYKII